MLTASGANIVPISLPQPEEPMTIGDLIKGIIKNPVDIAISLGSANQMRYFYRW
ncbi:MAG: hypothetical protein P0116_12345 [Candidatus Nitrosocosmicus sp.]|nr:hypothetical protein [Candidatus Nitrosocosmicus sp.]